ncbi:Kinesin, partial [Oryctes borbonicus]
EDESCQCDLTVTNESEDTEEDVELQIEESRLNLNMAKQSSKEEQHIHVSVRIRPNNPSEYETKSFLEVLSKKEILSKTTYNQKRYVFDRVFDSHSSQQEVYTSIVSPLIPEVIGGYNCTVFAYGQTGTGKTYTMEGVHDKE